MLDECLGYPIVADMNRLLQWDSPPPVIEHLLKFFQAGEKDNVWIPRIAQEEWIILTADRGRKGKAKLPGICVAYKVTHILMSGSVMKLKQSQKANAIISIWDKIKECNNAPKGSRFIMKFTHDGSVSLKKVILPVACGADRFRH